MNATDSGAAASPLDDAAWALVAGGASIGIGTRDARLRPHVVRAVGGRRDGARLVVFVPARPGRPVLDDIAANGRIAVVVSRPSTHRTVQLKGRDARIVPLEPGDRRLARAYRDALGRDLGLAGFDPRVVVPLLEGLEDELVAVAFTPEEGYDATPGPNAGAPLAGAR